MLAAVQVEHSNPTLERLIHQQKWPVVRDMVGLLGICPQRFVEQGAAFMSYPYVQANLL